MAICLRCCRGNGVSSLPRLMWMVRLHYPSRVEMENPRSSPASLVHFWTRMARCMDPAENVLSWHPRLNKARVIFEDVLAFMRQRYDLSVRDFWRVQDSSNRAIIEFRPTGARVRCIGSDPSKAHGLRPATYRLLDEGAQWDNAKSDRMLSAVRTGMGKVPNSKMIALGTRPASNEHWFAAMLDGTADYAQCHATESGDNPFLRSTWAKANPSLDRICRAWKKKSAPRPNCPRKIRRCWRRFRRYV